MATTTLVVGSIAAAGACWLCKTSCVTVNPDEIGAHVFLGKYKGPLNAGLHFLMPGSSVQKISTRIQENKVICETKTKDNVFVKLHIAVQQEVSRQHSFEAMYKLSDPKMQIEAFVADVVRGHVPKMTLDELFEAKESIAFEVKDRLAKSMTSYGYLIRQVLVVDLVPDEQVKQAMNEIQRSRRMRQAAEEKAEADKVVVVKAAEGEAERKFLQGQGTARARAAVVAGLKEAVCGSNNDKLSPKEVTNLLLMTQYLDTMEKMAHSPATTVFHCTGVSTSIMESKAANM